MAFGHPLFYWLWASWLKQPYENIWLRLLMSGLGLTLLFKAVNQNLTSRRVRILISVTLWIELPLYFSWMYLCNAGGQVWLPSLCVIVLVYYNLTDWRIATFGTLSGALVAWLLFHFSGQPAPGMPEQAYSLDAVLIAFSWSCALLLGLSSANLRRAHLGTTLATMGIMAHELRTPLSTAALIGDAIQLEAQRQPGQAHTAKLEKLGQRLHTLVRHMNHQIDTQIANAKLLQLPRYAEQVSAAVLAREAAESYPYPSKREQECVQVIIHDDFSFCTCATQFSQVLSNLIKNALHSLAAADSSFQAGALRIEVDRIRMQGRIVVADAGKGIDAALLPHIFKPFFSSNRNTGHGLGLAFCQQVVQSAGGSIQVDSAAPAGAAFTIMLPISDC
ncbi:MAG: integral rane sensor signal transduction histidine kinase [Polaromonas sp.]|nr:integral rane sensor signal transduction histidine kinase [Polaromonas sp.]